MPESKFDAEVFAECLEDAYKGLAWTRYFFKCALSGRKPDREWFNRRWAELRAKIKGVEDVDG